MRPHSVLLLPFLVACLPFGPAERKPPQAVGARAVLFIGNSHSYYHEVPFLVEWMARAAGDTALRVSSVAAPNFALEDHLATGWAREALETSRWRWVVLQQGTSALPENQLNLEYYTKVFEPMIRAAGADPVLYQIWPMLSRRFDADAALTSYWNAAVAVNGILAPAGDAFTAALEQVPPLEVYDWDGLHASELGAYVAAAVIHARLSGVAPESLPPLMPGSAVDSQTVRALQRAAATALARSPSRPTSRREPKVPPSALPDTLTASRPLVLSADSSFFPEGLDIDARDGTIYVTSIRHRQVFRAREGEALAPVLAADAELGAALGVRVDAGRQLLWVTTADLPYMRDPAAGRRGAELLAVSMASGEILARHALGDGRGIPGELALAPDGSVLVSDGQLGQLYRLRPGAASLEVLRAEGLRSPQGIAAAPDGRVAWVADWSRGLLRWDLTTNQISPVTTADGRRLAGVDGLLRAADGSLIAVQNGAAPPRILRLRLDAAGETLVSADPLDAATGYEGEPTVGALLGDRYLFVASSAWPFWDEQGRRRPGSGPLPSVVLRELRLPAPTPQD